MNDQAIITNYLSLLKSDVEVYVHGTIESSNEKVRNIIKFGLDETLNAQERAINKMVSLNMYEVSNVNVSDIKKTCNKLCKNKEN